MASPLCCPRCGYRVPLYDWQRDSRLRELGRCVDCKRENAEFERHWRCAACRAKRRARWARKREAAEYAHS